LMGYECGASLTTPSNNTLIGNQAGEYGTSLTTGGSNVIVGALSHTNAADTGRAVILGYNCAGTGSYHCNIGYGSTHRISNNYSANATWTRNSDERLKKNITTNTDCGLDFINDLRTVTFNWKAPSEIAEGVTGHGDGASAVYTDKMYGFIAQEVKTALDNHSITDFAGWTESPSSQGAIQGISYEMFVMPLVKAIQELSAKNDSLETSNTALAARITALENA